VATGAAHRGIGGERVRVQLAVLTLGYSRRLLVRAFRSEKQDHWLQTTSVSQNGHDLAQWQC
jgi:transposase